MSKKPMYNDININRKSRIYTILKIIIGMLLLFISVVLILNGLDKIEHTYFAQTFSEYIQSHGLPSLFGIVFLLDLFMSPLAPDIPVVISINYGANVVGVIVVAVLASSLAGLIASLLGRIIRVRWLRRWVGEDNFHYYRDLIKKHGGYIVSLGALTPIPYGVICYVSGIAKTKPWIVFLSSLWSRALRFSIFAFLSLYW